MRYRTDDTYTTGSYDYGTYDYDVDAPRAGPRPMGMDPLEWGGVRHEVAREATAEVVMLGLVGTGKSSLYAALRGLPGGADPPRLGSMTSGVEESMGFFTLLDLPASIPEDALLWDRLQRASLLVYVLDSAVEAGEGSAAFEVRSEDMRWLSRLQAMGRPLMVALGKGDLWADDLAGAVEDAERAVGLPVTPVSARGDAELHYTFLVRMIERCPDLAVPLGREVTAFRQVVARRMIRETALRCGLVALQPIPLLDLPVQLGAQVGLVARLAAMHGRLPASDTCKELVFAGAGSVVLRSLVQQAVKAVPVLGWLISGVLGALSALIVGEAALAVFEGKIGPVRIRTVLRQTWRGWARPRLVGLRERVRRAVWRVSPVRLWKRWRARRRRRRSEPDMGAIVHTLERRS